MAAFNSYDGKSLAVEFERGLISLRQLTGRPVAVFGSARLLSDSTPCRLAFLLGPRLAKAGFSVVHGDGPGVMNAVALGVRAAGGQSLGLTIIAPRTVESKPCAHSTSHSAHSQLFSRKAVFCECDAFIFFPGGIGTIDEFFEVMASMQLGTAPEKPTYLIGVHFWRPLLNYLRSLAKKGLVSPCDLNLFQLVPLTAGGVEKIVKSLS